MKKEFEKDAEKAAMDPWSVSINDVVVSLEEAAKEIYDLTAGKDMPPEMARLFELSKMRENLLRALYYQVPADRKAWLEKVYN